MLYGELNKGMKRRDLYLIVDFFYPAYMQIGLANVQLKINMTGSSDFPKIDHLIFK